MKPILSLLLAVLFSAAPAIAEDKTKKSDPAMDAMMAKWAAYSTPSAGHKVLDAMVGKWEAKTEMWMAPGAAPEESKGTSEFKWILGGRQLEHNFSGMAMGQPFNGRGYVGYDNFKKTYESVWMDDMGTGMMKMTGRYDPATKSITDTGEGLDHHTWTMKPMRTVTTFVNKDKFTFGMYSPDANGKEFLSFKITYTRKP